MNKTLQRYIPQGYKEYTPDIGDYPKDMFACYADVEKRHAIFYKGKSGKPLWHNRFFNLEQMKEKINKTISNLMSWEDTKAERKTKRIEARKAMDTSSIKIGDIFRWTGGYNCTRNDYAKVIEKVGKNKFKVARLSKYQVDGDWMNGNVAPRIDSCIEELVFTARPGWGDGIRLRNTKNGYRDDYTRWDGKPNWENCD